MNEENENNEIAQALDQIEETPTETPNELNPQPEQQKTIIDRLLSTQPDTPIEQISSPLDLTGDGTNHIYRGVQKLGLDGIPAGIDLLIGIALLINQKLDAQPETDDDNDSENVDITEMV